MRRTQLYLDDQLWTALHNRARSESKTVSELVREAVRERYIGKLDERRQAMQAIVGIRRETTGTPDSTEYVRDLRRGNRIERLGRK
jgi:Arc/MetJ family transcription regulator